MILDHRSSHACAQSLASFCALASKSAKEWNPALRAISANLPECCPIELAKAASMLSPGAIFIDDSSPVTSFEPASFFSCGHVRGIFSSSYPNEFTIIRRQSAATGAK
jgi:hypothetical protein